jgi:hypothetical protein
MAGPHFVGIVVLLSVLTGACGFLSDADEKHYFADTRPPDALEYEYLALATELHSIKPCYLIHPASLSAGAFGPVGSQVSLKRSRCFSSVAEASGNEHLCDKVRSASTFFLSGADLNAETCRDVARVTSVVSVELDVPGMVSLAGYEHVDVDAYLVSMARFSSMEVAKQYRRETAPIYWTEVRMTLLHTEDFFERIARLPGFGAADDQAEMNAVRWAPRQQRLWTPPEQRNRAVPEIRVPAQ